MAKTDNIKSIFANKKWLYGIVTVAVLLLGFGGYKWYNRNAFAKAVDGHVYKVTQVEKSPKKTRKNTIYVAYKIDNDKLYTLNSFEPHKEVGVLKRALSTKDVYNNKSHNYDKTYSIYEMNYTNSDYEDIETDIFVQRHSLDLSKTYDPGLKTWTKSDSKKLKIKITNNGYTMSGKDGKTKIVITATRVD
ncbi:hypothetical protein [Ligilactobacillus salivarius]|uniref:hypothetical protein n=1 Tax=Ligilactobacillus salivarius TaxID=1624 RepID=UPI0022E6F241|nr:hypothetical protein [Ligilactobacillus salivarius]